MINRIKTRSKQRIQSKLAWGMIGIPDHQGVINVGGRIGASSGPHHFRKIFRDFKNSITLYKYGQDFGDVQPLTLNVEENLKMAASAITKMHHEAQVTIVVGGGHDHGYSQVKGIVDFLSTDLSPKKSKYLLGCINIDAHLDVRKPNPLITSGSPFYLAIEGKYIHPKNFIEFGIQSHCNSPELWDYILSRKIRTIPFQSLRDSRVAQKFEKELEILNSYCHKTVVSLDLDSIAQAFAPGVSAPQSEGFSSREILQMMEIAGRNKKVISLGIFELNPLHDIGDLTSRLAVTSAVHFLNALKN